MDDVGVSSHHVMNYVECDLADDLTLPQWRHNRAAAVHHRRHLRLRLAFPRAHR
jgi:hypothetical protein